LFVVCYLGDTFEIMRGYWFIEPGWQPLDDEYASVIEKEHVTLFGDELLSRNNRCSLEHQTKTKSSAGCSNII